MVRKLFTSRRKVRLPLAQDTAILAQRRSRANGAILRTGLIFGGAGLGGLALFAFLAMGPLAPNGGEEDTVAIAASELEPSGTVAAIGDVNDTASAEMVSADELAPNSTDEAQESIAAAKPEASNSDNRQERAVTTAAEMPAADDPRWGDADQQTASSMHQGEESDLGRALSALGQTEPQRSDAASAFSGLLDSEDRPANASATVPVAESEEDILALEEMQRQENAMLIAAIGNSGAGNAAAGGQPATVTAYVNLRDAPNNSSNVITIVPANADIESSEECPLQWCEVTYQGQSGYIYQGYVRHAAR